MAHVEVLLKVEIKYLDVRREEKRREERSAYAVCYTRQTMTD